jgi:hypothetical protein
MKQWISNIVLVILIAIPVAVFAQEEEEKSPWEINGYLKNLQSASLLHVPNFITGEKDLVILSNTLIHNRLNFSRTLGSKVVFNTSLRNRFLYGDLDDPQRMLDQFELGNDHFDLSLEASNTNWAAQTIMDRLYFDIYLGDWEISVGRQRINWGISTFWNSNDIFNAFNFTDFDYEERPGSDALLVRKYIGFTSSIEFAVAAASDIKELKAGLLYKFNFKNYDYQILAGVTENYLSIGGGWSGAIKQIGFKGEFNTFNDLSTGSDPLSGSLSVEFDYINKKALYFGLGFLYNSIGETDTNILNLLDFDISARNLYPFKYTLFYSMNQSFNPIFSGGLSFLYSPGEAHATFVSPNLNFSISQNWDLAFFGQIVLDKQDTYASPIQGFFLRLKYSF